MDYKTSKNKNRFLLISTFYFPNSYFNGIEGAFKNLDK